MPDQMSPALNSGKQALLVIGLIAALFIGVILYRSLAIGHEARREIVNLYGKLRPGLSVSEVKMAFLSNQFKRLRLIEASSELVMVRTPLEWNANNWLLYVDLTNGQVYQVRIRLEDDAQLKPAEAPSDKRGDSRFEE